jgi:hypothetical protein
MPPSTHRHRSRRAGVEQLVEQLELSPGGALDPEPEHLTVQPPCSQRRFQPLQDRQLDTTVGIPRVDERRTPSKRCGHVLFAGRHGAGQFDKVAPKTRGSLLELGEHHVPHPIPHPVEIEIAAVLAPSEPSFSEPALDRLSAPRQQGADDPVGGLGGDPGHGPRAGPAEKLNKDPLGDVVPVVPGGDRRDSPSAGVVEQCPITPPPPCGLSGGGVEVVDRKLERFEVDLELSAHASAEPGVLICLNAAQPVMNVGGLESQAEHRFSEQVKKRHRVATARQGHQHRSTHQVWEAALEVGDEVGGLHRLDAISESRNT